MFVLLGFMPTFGLAWILKKLGMLRVPIEVELVGLDHESMLEDERQANEVKKAEWEALQSRILHRADKEEVA